MKKNILILGGTGFIGRNIVEDLLHNNYTIVVLVRNIKNNSNQYNSADGITLVEGDIQQYELIESILLEHKIDLVIHLVSNLIPSSSLADFNVELSEVVFPTFGLLELFSKLNVGIVYFSSGGTIYGKANDLIDEHKQLNPINYYGYSKLMIENHIRFLNTTQKLSYLILRPSNVYGKYQKIEAQQGFIAVALGKFISNSSIEIWGNGEVVRDFIDVQDVSEGLRKLIEANIANTTLNMGSGEGKSLNQVVSILENILERSIAIIYKDKREVDLDRMVLNINKIKNYIDFNPKSLKSGINNFVEFIGVDANEK
jgi:UDP-glucose 4-epimerase